MLSYCSRLKKSKPVASVGCVSLEGTYLWFAPLMFPCFECCVITDELYSIARLYSLKIACIVYKKTCELRKETLTFAKAQPEIIWLYVTDFFNCL